MKFNTLGLTLKESGYYKGNIKKVTRYYDFTIDGLPLSEIINVDERAGSLGYYDKKFDQYFIEMLLLKRKLELPFQRLIFYGCPLDLDLYCGAITADVERFGDIILWKNFAYQSSEELPDALSFQKSNSICFEFNTYKKFFEDYLQQHTNLPLNDWTNGW